MSRLVIRRLLLSTTCLGAFTMIAPLLHGAKELGVGASGAGEAEVIASLRELGSRVAPFPPSRTLPP